MIELEVKELIARHKSDMSEKGAQITLQEDLNQQLTESLNQKISEKNELNAKIKNMQEGWSSVVHYVNSSLCTVLHTRATSSPSFPSGIVGRVR